MHRINELATDATVLVDDTLSIQGSSVSDAEEEIKEWATAFLVEE